MIYSIFSKSLTMKRTLLFFFCISFLFQSCRNSDYKYTIETDVNPNEISPLTAMLNIKSDMPCSVSVKVLGDIPVQHSYEEIDTILSIPVLGLYPNQLNKVEVTLNFGGQEVTDIVKIKTPEIPEFFPSIRVNTLEKDLMEPGMHAMDIHFANFGKL